jgi:hypothetical protein
MPSGITTTVHNPITQSKPAIKKVLPGCHKSGVSILVGDCIGGRRLVKAVARLGTNTG